MSGDSTRGTTNPGAVMRNVLLQRSTVVNSRFLTLFVFRATISLKSIFLHFHKKKQKKLSECIDRVWLNFIDKSLRRYFLAKLRLNGFNSTGRERPGQVE